ncbi:hypothetical protein CEUSTIGMA_g12496.t1 [Chlamydomonas eustigma]|uniref:SET domain-containing protein n=1 Tax=Chlamydomonas eustigma TaxID=1157962 RepID=A0A250XPV9_9CHLO|nr:hypothetical protein CEUSTIGMA_g12496.t1 [Chlamydomonas eustigma]|eukprot:GAX85076.1 hypothetical protein CEUSTIGMA_g12496.t1 [Chlamydomonas eustigma]
MRQLCSKNLIPQSLLKRGQVLQCHCSQATTSPHVHPLGKAIEAPHVSVLLNEVLDAFSPVDLKVYVDCTLGAGGHAIALAKAHSEMEHLVGIDLDPTAHAIAQERLKSSVNRSCLTTSFVHGNYSEVDKALSSLPSGQLNGQVDGMLMDLGVSSMQLDTAERGFSFLREGPIDMRMDPSASMSAEEIINTYSEAQLGRIIREYGEEKSWRSVARRIVEAREQGNIKTTQQLTQIIGATQWSSGKGKRGGGLGSKQIHPATRTFQALRIAVNDELGKLETALPVAIRSLRPGGRLAVISFHSLEDRIVKHCFLRAAGRPTPEEEHLTYGDQKYDYLDALERNAIAILVSRKPVTATEAEIAANPRSRSAKLRIIERRVASGEQVSVKKDAVQVKETGDGRGNGAFATIRIPKGTHLCDYDGELISNKEYWRRYPEGVSNYVTEIDEEWHIDATAVVGQTSSFSAVHMNHSRSRKNVKRCKMPEARRVAFFAARDIAVGEELLYDYGSKYWEGRREQEMP